MPTRAEHRDTTESAIIAAGQRLLAEGGADALTIRGVARELDLVPSALYRYVTKREDLLDLLVQHAHAKAALEGLEKLYQLKVDQQDVERALTPETLRGHYQLQQAQFAYGDNPAALTVAQLIEAERKYALTTGQELPDLAAVITPGPVGEFELTATYYDAPDLRLTRAWQVIRHRVGGADAGWHLKLPGPTSDQRIEVHADGAAPRVPDEFRRRVATTLAGAPLVPVASERAAGSGPW